MAVSSVVQIPSSDEDEENELADGSTLGGACAAAPSSSSERPLPDPVASSPIPQSTREEEEPDMTPWLLLTPVQRRVLRRLRGIPDNAPDPTDWARHFSAPDPNVGAPDAPT